MTRKELWLLSLALFGAAFLCFMVFALNGLHPAWMVATFVFTLATVVSAALAFSSP